MDTRRYTDATTFEEACGKAWFSDLILLVLSASAALRRFTDRTGADRHPSGATSASGA